jgi:hypothetical protein
MKNLHSFVTQFAATGSGIRRELFEGTEHLVVPVVMIVEGVLNGALLLADEFGMFPDSWNGRPVPVLHPENNGGPVSANSPDIIQANTIGCIFGTTLEGTKLKSEVWLNVAKATALGHAALLDELAGGGIVEVSTGYYAEDDPKTGSYDGKPYTAVHRGIRPDHLALLPGQVGACSVADGCGTRVNSQKGVLAMKVSEAWAVIGKSLGLKQNCDCEETPMDVIKKATALVKANALDAKQLAAIQSMSPADRDLMIAFATALAAAEASAPAEEPAEMTDEDEMAAAEEHYEDGEPKAMTAKKAAKPLTNADIDVLIANGVKAHMARADVIGRLVGNERNTLTSEQMSGMSIADLISVELMIRPADYSGASGFANNSGASETVTAMIPRGVLAQKSKAS